LLSLRVRLKLATLTVPLLANASTAAIATKIVIPVTVVITLVRIIFVDRVARLGALFASVNRITSGLHQRLNQRQIDRLHNDLFGVCVGPHQRVFCVFCADDLGGRAERCVMRGRVQNCIIGYTRNHSWKQQTKKYTGKARRAIYNTRASRTVHYAAMWWLQLFFSVVCVRLEHRVSQIQQLVTWYIHALT
jgi:hypothetical protein